MSFSSRKVTARTDSHRTDLSSDPNTDLTIDPVPDPDADPHGIEPVPDPGTAADRLLILGDNINTDDIIPAQRGTNPDPAYLKHYALEHVIGAGNLLKYDAIEAGENFGCGSSREFAPVALKAAGIQRVRARSFAEIFYRNSINIGLPLAFHGESDTHPIVAAIAQAGGLLPFSQARQRGEVQLPSCQTPPRPMTLTEKLLARSSGNAFVAPGEVLFIRVDLAMSHDAIAATVGDLFHQHFGAAARLWDADRVVLVADHFIQVNDIRLDPHARRMYDRMVEFAQAQGCRLLDWVAPGEAAGICHVLLPEQGLIRPGMTIAGTDSHSCTYGAFGCFATGIGTTDMANLFATGELWLRVPQTRQIELTGRLAAGISAKDIMLFLLGQIGCNGALGQVLEFCGEGVTDLSIDERMTLANMAVECGAVCGLIAPDDRTYAYLSQQTGLSVAQLQQQSVFADADAGYAERLTIDLSYLQAQVACPPRPDCVLPISEVGDVPITKAFIGSCTGGKLEDLAAAAAVLRQRQVADSVELFVVPASQQVLQQARSLGYVEILTAAGAQILKSGCGACINAGKGVLNAEETGIYATNRNFKGRSGDPTAHQYLASPRVVAISAVQGKISDRLD